MPKPNFLISKKRKKIIDASILYFETKKTRYTRG